MSPITIGERIKELRTKNGISQNTLANKTGLSEISIRKYEAGDRVPKIEQIEKIAVALAVPIERIVSPEVLQSRRLNEANWGLIAVLKSVYDTVDLEWEQHLDNEGIPEEPSGEFAVTLVKGKEEVYLTKQNWETLFAFVCNNLPTFVQMAQPELPD